MDADLLTNLSLESDGSDHENVDRNLSVGEDEGCNLDKNNQEHPCVDFEKRNPVRVLLNGNDSLHHLHLELHQISPKREMGGVHSNIWDGGLGLVRYLSDVYGNEWKHVTVCDLGAGTGVVGLGTAVASAARAVVAMTDLPRAMPLLSENIKLNQKHWIRGEDSAIPKCSVLEWGKPVSKEWLRALIEQGTLATPKEERTFVITGADVVYRRSLFEPLLATLCELSTRVRELANKKYTKMECLLACQSIRSHVSKFSDCCLVRFEDERMGI